MLRSSPFRGALLAGVTVATLGVAAVGAAPAAPPTMSAPEMPAEISTVADALLAADTSAATPAAAGSPDGLRAKALRRLATWKRLVHATAVVDLPKLGGLTTVQLDHGTVSSASATQLVIAEAGGASITVDLADTTRVRRAGTKAKVTDVAKGDEVFVLSKVESGAAEAYLVVVPRT